MNGATRPRLTPLLLASFAAVFLIWGSTYLAIRYAIETIPPLTMAGLRFLAAGAILFPVAYLTGDRAHDRLTAVHWRSALVIGSLLLLASNGVITLAEQHVASGLVALLVATVPLWMAVLGHATQVQRVSRVGAAGLAAGLLGVGLMLRPGSAGAVSPGWIAFTLISPLAWAVGSIYARSAPMPRRSLLATSMEMLCGGAVICVAAALLGEWGQFHPGAISAVSLAGFAYLVVAGSLVGYTAYTYLNGRVSPQAASSYAYVNPLVAVLLGWAVAGESVTPMTLVAGGLIVLAVVILLAGGRRRAVQPGADAVERPCPAATEGEVA
jgi:drug/metabolite transporter (DMT)-like permease